MKQLNLLALIIMMVSSLASFAQDGVSIGNWRTHLPYQKVIDVEPVGNKIYAATPFELFYYDTQDNSINILNKINGLSDIGISNIGYNESQRKLLVAYTNANVDLVCHDGAIHNMSDIKEKNIVGNKSINNVFFDGDLAYIACGFGIVVFDLKKEEVKDTYYIGNHGDAVNVTDVAIYSNRIYASTDDGLYYADLNATNLANYAAWHFDTSVPHPHLAYTEMEVFGNRLYVNYDGGFNADTLYVLNGSQWDYFDKEDVTQKMELRAYNDRFITTNRYGVRVFDYNNNLMLNIFSPGGSIEPLSTACDPSGNYWIGDLRRGLLKTNDGWNNMDVRPNGPASQNVFELQASGDQVWIATGGHASNWGKRYMKEGVARFDGSWTILNANTLPDFGNYSDFVCTATDPKDPSITYVGTWGNGILKFKGNELVEVYDDSNSTLQPWMQDMSLINVSGLAFDSKGNLWVANTGAPSLLSVMERNGTWHAFSLGGSLSGIDIGTLLVDDNDYKWIIRRGGELIVFNENKTFDNPNDDQTVTLNTATGSGHLAGAVNCLTVDNTGAVWAGTDLGPCLFDDTRALFNGSGNYDATQKKVPRNDGTNFADYLLTGVDITCMAVDGGNRKWFGTNGNGVYLISADNYVQVHHFLTTNSQLLSNNIESVTINDQTGEVFFGTDMGLCSYMSDASATTDEMTTDNVYAYPNPVRPDYTGLITVTGLSMDADVKIVTASGALVAQGRSNGGSFTWDGCDSSGHRVASGVYMVMTATKEGKSGTVCKIAIVN